MVGIADDAVEIRARGWRTLAALHGISEMELERSLQREFKRTSQHTGLENHQLLWLQQCSKLLRQVCMGERWCCDDDGVCALDRPLDISG